MPKRRGFSFKALSINPVVINFKTIEKNFNNNEVVSPEALLVKGLIKRKKGIIPKVKILSTGELKKKVVFKNCSFSKSAQSRVVEK